MKVGGELGGGRGDEQLGIESTDECTVVLGTTDYVRGIGSKWKWQLSLSNGERLAW